MESNGFKEWAIVCDAMGRGEQCVILRKGGIAEGREGFAFRHSEFFLFPTFFHEQVNKVRIASPVLPEERSGEIEIQFFAKLIAATQITSLDAAMALESLHILQPAVVRERFEYDRAPGLHVALVRAFRLEPAWILADAPRYGGCRSWVSLPEHPRAIQFEPVLTDEEHDRRVKEFNDIAGTAIS